MFGKDIPDIGELPGESAAGHLHVDIFVSHRGDGTNRFHHMADHVDDGQVDDGPVGSRGGYSETPCRSSPIILPPAFE